MTYRENGGKIGPLDQPTATSGSGIYTLAEQQQLKGAGKWPQVFSSPQAAADSGATTEGYYSYYATGMSAPLLLWTRFNMADSRAWVRVFSAPFASTATVNEINKNIPWKGFLLQRDSNDYRGIGYFTTLQQYVTRSDTSTATSGTYAGYRIYAGQAGGHGFYNTLQSPCNWQYSNSALGAGFDGSCGSWPNGMRFGVGQTNTPNYTMIGGVWETWLWWDG